MPINNNFFTEPNMDENKTTEVEKIKLGEKEFTQDELNKLVGLGEVAAELESKWNTKIDQLNPAFTKATQKLKELEKENEELKKAVAPKKTEDGQPTEEQIRQQVLADAKKFGLMTTEDFEENYKVRRGAERLLEDIDSLKREAETAGKPVPNTDALLSFMHDNGVKAPDKAYKLMYEEELDKWKEQQLGKAKPKGFTSPDNSSQGKSPTLPKPTRDNLGQLLSAHLSE